MRLETLPSKWMYFARNLEEPFGLTEDHLNLEALTNVIETSTNQILLDNKMGEN